MFKHSIYKNAREIVYNKIIIAKLGAWTSDILKLGCFHWRAHFVCFLIVVIA